MRSNYQCRLILRHNAARIDYTWTETKIWLLHLTDEVIRNDVGVSVGCVDGTVQVGRLVVVEFELCLLLELEAILCSFRLI